MREDLPVPGSAYKENMMFLIRAGSADHAMIRLAFGHALSSLCQTLSQGWRICSLKTYTV